MAVMVYTSPHPLIKTAMAMNTRALCSILCISAQLSAQQPEPAAALSALARDGNPGALYAMGLLAESGSGQQKDPTRAAQLYGQAAAAGHASAKVRLAQLFQRGSGVPRDLARAFALYQEAAASDPEAQFQVALCLLKGNGTTTDVAAARQWLARAANADHQEAQLMLGLMLQQGVGGARNEYAARRWLQRAATGLNDSIAQRASTVQRQIDEKILGSSKSSVDEIIVLALAAIAVGALLDDRRGPVSTYPGQAEHERQARRLQCETNCTMMAHAATKTVIGMLDAATRCQMRC
jgi:hypothetical protein